MSLVWIVGGVVVVLASTPKLIQLYRRRNFPVAQFFHKSALERHTLNHRGRGNQEVIDKATEGVE